MYLRHTDNCVFVLFLFSPRYENLVQGSRCGIITKFPPRNTLLIFVFAVEYRPCFCIHGIIAVGCTVIRCLRGFGVSSSSPTDLLLCKRKRYGTQGPRYAAYKMQNRKSNLVESSNLLFKPPKSEIHAVCYRRSLLVFFFFFLGRAKNIPIYIYTHIHRLNLLSTIYFASKNINTSIQLVLLLLGSFFRN